MDGAYLHQFKTQKTLFMTKAGLDNLRQRLDMLMHDRLKVIERMRTMDYEDRADPLTLADEVRRLEASEAEVATISDILQRVEPIVKDKVPDHVQIGSEVTVRHKTKEVTYTVVCSLEMDIEKNKISDECPLGAALLGKKLRDSVTIPVKGAEYIYEIIGIK